jgi:hypothetical protein
MRESQLEKTLQTLCRRGILRCRNNVCFIKTGYLLRFSLQQGFRVSKQPIKEDDLFSNEDYNKKID